MVQLLNFCLECSKYEERHSNAEIKKLLNGDGDALVVAKAAIDRLINNPFKDPSTSLAPSGELNFSLVCPAKVGSFKNKEIIPQNP